jgi:exodeoxyribonuclease-5
MTLISSTFTPTIEQSRALDAIHKWLSTSGKPFFTLHGLAGTGKTTLVSYLAAQYDEPVYAMAFSGKAASVLTRKGLPATTIHSRIYQPPSESNEAADMLQRELIELEKNDPDSPKIDTILRKLEKLRRPEFDVLRSRRRAFPASYDETADVMKILGQSVDIGDDDEDDEDEPPHGGLILLDECSMVDEKLARDLISFGFPILVLGDPGQLPPVKGTGYFDQHPDFTLTEIHRQALESPVIRLAMQAREGRRLKLGIYGASRVISRKAIGKEEALGVEQILCGSNKARVKLNHEVRILRGLAEHEFPRKDERLICLRNNRPQGLLNGMVVQTIADTINDEKEPYIQIPVQEWDHPITVHRECFTRPEIVKSWALSHRRTANEFDYAYAITIHKSQGSQFKDVLVVPDYGFWDKDLYARLLYTALTRAEERVIVAL